MRKTLFSFMFPSKHEIKPFFEQIALDLCIWHKLILPYTLRHNGKAEHSHHNSLERVYNHLCVYSCIDVRLQMKKYFRRSKRSSMEVFGWKSPIQRVLFEW